MAVGSVSISQQMQSWRAGQDGSNARFLVVGTSSAQTELAIGAASAAADSFARAALSYHNDAGTLAALAGIELASKTMAQAAGPKSPADEIGSQVTFYGSLAGVVNFGAEGPAVSGGFQFVTGSALKDAFKTTMLGIKSHGEAIDTMSVTGSTLTARTSGGDAHDVFTLTLRPEGGTWTFALLNPIDLPTRIISSLSKLSEPVPITLNLSALMQGVKSSGQTIALPNTVKITVDNERIVADGTAIAGTVHQGGLAYSPPNTNPNPTPYRPPINPATGYRFVATSTASAAIGATINLFA